MLHSSILRKHILEINTFLSRVNSNEKREGRRNLIPAAFVNSWLLTVDNRHNFFLAQRWKRSEQLQYVTEALANMPRLHE